MQINTQEPTSPFRKINLFGTTSPSTRAPIGVNDAFRFQVGINYKAKIIGLEEVPEARGDRMCQDVIQKQKAFIKATGAHKQQIHLNVSLEGIKLVDLRTGQQLHHHPVHRISFISRDVTDARAFGYIFGPGDGKHIFFGIKTEKAAENVVLTLRDLFQVVFEMKKKESEEEKSRKIEIVDKSETKIDVKITEKQAEELETTTEQTTPEVESPGLLDLDTLGFTEASKPVNAFDPVGGASDPFVTSTAQPSGQSQLAGAFSSDPFAATSSNGTQNGPQAPSNLPFSPQSTQPAQDSWATFSPTNPQPAAQTSPFSTNVAATTQGTNPFSGGFGSSDPFGAGAFGGTASTNAFSPTPAAGGFGGSAFGGTAGGGSSMQGGGFGATQQTTNSVFGGPALTPTPTEQPKSEPEPPVPPKRTDMFSNLVDTFGVGFGTQKVPEQPKSMNAIAIEKQSQQQQAQPFGNTNPMVNQPQQPLSSGGGSLLDF